MHPPARRQIPAKRVVPALARGASREDLLAALRAEGVAPGEDVEVVWSLVGDGLLLADGER